ncbi:MAG: hypothetical protein COB50_05610 [Thiotrichales bacterium]|nr:MAG: hypothetical protein COB50_05610 [Thiotrichales bacterium]
MTKMVENSLQNYLKKSRSGLFYQKFSLAKNTCKSITYDAPCNISGVPTLDTDPTTEINWLNSNENFMLGR